MDSEKQGRRHETAFDDGLLHQVVDSNSKPHITNYIKEFASIMRNYRTNLPDDQRSATKFGESVLSKYFGQKIPRSRIVRAESGHIGTHWGVIAAYIYEMGIFPEFISLCIKGYKPTQHHAILVHGEIKRKVEEANRIAKSKLAERAAMENKYGYAKW